MSPARPAAPTAPAAAPVPAGPPACSDAERRAARACAAALRAGGRVVRTEALWVRPAWAAVLAACAAAGVAASVVSVDHPVPGLVIAATAFVLALAELGPWPVLRRLTYARATQNVIAEDPPPAAATVRAAASAPAPAAAARPPVTLILVAAVDGPRGGIAHRLRLPVRAITTAALGLVAALAAARVAFDASGTLVGAVQLVPTAALVLAVGGLADAAVAPPASAPGGTPPAEMAVAAARALGAIPRPHLGVEVVLAGAWPLGWRARRRRDRRGPQEVVVGFVGSDPRLRFATAHPALRALAERTGLAARRGRAPREGRRPAIAVAGTAADTTAFLVAFAAALDGDLGRPGAQPASGERSANSVK
jgi:hypothetical protein